MKTKLVQEHLIQNGCTVINYVGTKIMVDIFYNQSMYERFLEGLDCRQGMGMYGSEQELDFNQIPDEKMVVVQENGNHVKTYKFTTLFKATMSFKERREDGKLYTRNLTFGIRKNIFGSDFNLVIANKNTHFSSLEEIKQFLKEKYGDYTII